MKVSTKRLVSVGLAAVISGLLSTSVALAAPPAHVSTGDDDGPGSLREALASGATKIIIHAFVSSIVIENTLFYDGTEPLRIIGSGQTVESNYAQDDFTLFEVTNGADLTIQELNFDGGGGFDFYSAGIGKGIFVSVPDTRTGIVRLKLTNVIVSGVANHGIHVSDCSLGDDCGSGGGGGGDGSAASVHATLTNVIVDDAGNGKFDADGVRIDERNDGDIDFRATRSHFTGVGADGVELDEGNNGDVIVDVVNSTFDNNGGYCLDSPLDIEEPCVEEDNGDLVLDLDDGFDIDEAGDGSLTGSVKNAEVRDNWDEGLDFDEEGDGGMRLDLVSVDAIANGDEGIKISAAGSGNVHARLRAVTAIDNNDDGIQIEAEDGDGQVHVRVNGTTAKDNANDGLEVTQEEAVLLGTLRVRGSDIDEIDTENVDEI